MRNNVGLNRWEKNNTIAGGDSSRRGGRSAQKAGGRFGGDGNHMQTFCLGNEIEGEGMDLEGQVIGQQQAVAAARGGRGMHQVCQVLV